ncbi:hypothetical protein B0H13DRAFT_2152182 [Mycena leptocephala]|nr:hypothetical protein B0H13DRAFT_2152182 [Mycena leptocephala]
MFVALFRSPISQLGLLVVFKENVYASLIDCAQRVSAPAEGAGHSDVSSWITSELGWNVRRPQVQAPRSRSRDASLLGPCRLKDGAPPLEVQAQTRGSRTLCTTGRSSSSPALSLLAPVFSVESSHQVFASRSRPTRCNTHSTSARVVLANSRTETSLVG